MTKTPGISLLVLGPPGSGKSSLARKALEAEGSGVVALALGMSEETSYKSLRGNQSYIVKGYDDPEFFPSMPQGLKASGYDQLLSDLRGVYAGTKTVVPAVLVTDTFSSMSQLAMNKTFQKFGKAEPPPAMSPDGASFWGHQRMLLDSITRICRAIRGNGSHWIATCHVTEKEMKEVGPSNPEQLGKSAGYVPAIAGGFRDVFAAEFDLVLYAGVRKDVDKTKPPIHYLQWRPDPKRPTKSRYGKLAETGAFLNSWTGLMEKINAADAAEVGE
jgi:hypothetical protein